eukprot:scaffold392_cov350-Prasinococcus_capsulatus_cf.AAC.4
MYRSDAIQTQGRKTAPGAGTTLHGPARRGSGRTDALPGPCTQGHGFRRGEAAGLLGNNVVDVGADAEQNDNQRHVDAEVAAGPHLVHSVAQLRVCVVQVRLHVVNLLPRPHIPSAQHSLCPRPSISEAHPCWHAICASCVPCLLWSPRGAARYVLLVPPLLILLTEGARFFRRLVLRTVHPALGEPNIAVGQQLHSDLPPPIHSLRHYSRRQAHGRDARPGRLRDEPDVVWVDALNAEGLGAVGRLFLLLERHCVGAIRNLVDAVC